MNQPFAYIVTHWRNDEIIALRPTLREAIQETIQKDRRIWEVYVAAYYPDGHSQVVDRRILASDEGNYPWLPLEAIPEHI